MKMRVLGLALAGAAALSLTTAVEATIINYTFGGAGSGTMSLNFNGSSYSWGTLSLTVGTATFTQSNSVLAPETSPYYLIYSGNRAPNMDGVYFFFDPASSSQTALTFTWSNVGDNNVHTGDTLTITQGAVPEPASWAMMLLGFGAIGFAMRRKARIAALPA